MNALDLDTLSYLHAEIVDSNEEFSIPLDISDIINICREYSNLGWQVQNQVEQILEVGVEESIKSGFVKKESLPHIKNFLISIHSNPYWGDASAQADICVKLISKYELNQKSDNLN
jgi:hypothetical protein